MAKLKKLSIHFWIWDRHSIQSITEVCSLWFQSKCSRTAGQFLTKRNTICTNWSENFRSSRLKCRSTTSTFHGSFVVPHTHYWYNGHTTWNLKKCLFGRCMFDLDISPTQSFPCTWKAITTDNKWLSANKLTLDPENIFYQNFGRTNSIRATLWRNKKHLKTKSSIKNSGIDIDSDLTFKTHFSYVSQKHVKWLVFFATANKHYHATWSCSSIKVISHQ